MKLPNDNVKLTGKQCQCRHCGELFTRLRAFERHRVGPFSDKGIHRRCLTPEEMAAKGWTKNRKGFWVIETQAQRPPRAAGWKRNGPELH